MRKCFGFEGSNNESRLLIGCCDMAEDGVSAEECGRFVYVTKVNELRKRRKKLEINARLLELVSILTNC